LVDRTFHLGARSSDELTRMVMAIGTLLGWESACSIEYRPTEPKRAVLARVWTANGSGSGAPAIPEWVDQLDASSWGHHRLLWRRAAAKDPRGRAALAVPVSVDGEICGALVFLAAVLDEPDSATLALLEATAGLLGRAGSDKRDRDDRVSADDPGSSHVDVFAYTVRVAGDGSLQWRYFGPNSHAIFGQGIYPGDDLITLLERHAAMADADRVREFGRALVEGQRVETELRISGLDGLTRWVTWRTEPRWNDGALFVDGVATDVSARRAVERSNGEMKSNDDDGEEQGTSLQQHAIAVREANDAVLQRLFAAGLRLQMLKRKLGDTEAHAVTAIAFQLDQAANDLREVILGLNAVASAPTTAQSAAAEMASRSRTA
jgi:hypothetical protein